VVDAYDHPHWCVIEVPSPPVNMPAAVSRLPSETTVFLGSSRTWSSSLTMRAQLLPDHGTYHLDPCRYQRFVVDDTRIDADHVFEQSRREQ
jgi:hypothetical protein